ncbi:methyl-accepting chemotaxis protein [Halomonas sp. TD01]|uniref:methyl-accepting chemotaxis protein n=1 Tax=Halomonas sp. TD01 TaxID=999141 RepID=UPI000214F5E9|nr:methyl-accepting chemotaxis protein [Halomonas sp. TD01]EGP18605.1 methyl-accepting chemotaxis sensory transducer [Halomonas sp. TD01]CAH1044748.1 Methyl-accepting chemotaxis protein [Halomonas sp. TD01]
MRLLQLLVPLAVLGVSVWMMTEPGVFPYIALLLATGAGASLMLVTITTVYSADRARLAKPIHGLKPIRDYASLRAMAYRLMNRASSTAIASAEVSHYADLMAQRLTKQETMASDASSSMSAINTAIMQVSASASQVASLAESARQASHHNHDELADIIRDMSDVSERSDQALEMLSALNDKIERVRNVTSMIEGIAEQTHLLSLNASIEAARAGEHGRGFAVVAGEVRNLALKTSTATQSVDELVKDMHQSGQSVVGTMGALMNRIRERSQGMQQVGSSLATITGQFDQVEQEITSVAEAMESTKAHSQTVADSLRQLEDDVDEGNRDMRDLAQQARALMEAAEGVDGELAQQRLQGRHQHVFSAARQAADRIGKLFEKAIAAGELSETALFQPDYRAMPGTRPPLYHTSFDAFTDLQLPSLQEPLLTEYGLSYAIACDRNGYVPTHNAAVSREPSGDYDHDLKYCRSKRIFDDPTGSRCGAHEKPLLLQTYKRDTGEIMHDLSVPIYIKGKHWGGFRVGYQPEKPNDTSALIVEKSVETASDSGNRLLART